MAQPPNVLQGPEPVETGELHFKLCSKLKVFEETEYEKGHCSILAVSQLYGLIFVGDNDGFSVIKTKALGPNTDLEKYPRKKITTRIRPTHLSIDFTQKILAVVCSCKPSSALFFYNLYSFERKFVTPAKIVPISKLIENPAAEVIDLAWQPVNSGSLMLCMSDGSVLAFSKGDKDGPMFNLPSTTQATCFCWSPKGKQIVIGSGSGTLSQYMPNLKIVKTLPSPPLFDGAAMVVNVLWISNFQFAVAYNDTANPESFPVITIVNAAKNERVNVINYYDITFSTTLFRNHQIYMHHQSAWNLIFVSSANSIEVAVLHSGDGSSWKQWLLGDASRAELPLDSDRQETFPLGWAFDFTSQENIPWGEEVLPPMPRLLLVSDEGLLCAFNIVNTSGNAPQLCASPTENLDDSLFTITNKTTPQPGIELSEPADTKTSLLGSPPVLGNPNPTFSFEPSPGFWGLQATKSLASSPAPTPTPAAVPNPTAAVVPTSTPALLPTPTPVVVPTPTPALLPTPAPASLPTSTPALVPSSAPALVPTPTPALVPSPAPAPAVPTITQPVKKDLGLFSNKNLSHFTTKNQSEVSFTPEKPFTTPAPAVSKSSETVAIAGKAEEVTAHGDSPVPGAPELAAVDDSVYLNAMQEEIEHFSSELQQLSAKVSKLDVTVGTEEDKAKMKKNIDDLYDFWKELKETTEGQSGEIHAVVMDLMEAFAWLEDAKSRNLQRKNPSYIELKKSEELDPLSARHMSEIAHLKYYIENQVIQLARCLDKEWMDYQENYRNEVKSKMAVPPLEEVYKTMHFQLKILHKQKALVEELKERIAAKKRKSKSQSLISSMDSSIQTHNSKSRVSELSKLAENLLQLKIDKDQNNSRTGTREMMKVQLSAISERSKKLTREKQTALREALSECDTVKIRPVKTTLESSSFLRSLALEKVKPKLAKLKSVGESEEPKEIKKDSAKSGIFSFSKPEFGVKPPPEVEKPKISQKEPAVVFKPAISKTNTVEKPVVPLTVQSLPKQEEKSPLDSLSGIVSNIGKKAERPFVFGSVNFKKPELSKDVTIFGSQKPEQKGGESSETPQVFTFSVSKQSEPVFAKEAEAKGEKPTFSFSNSTFVLGTTLDLTKTTPAPSITVTSVTTTPTPSVTITPITTTPSTTASSQSALPADKTTANAPAVVKSLFFGNTTTTTTGSLFIAPPTVIQTSASIFGTSTPIFGAANKNTTITFGSVTPLSNVPKTLSEAVVQPSSFTISPSVDSKTVIVANTVASPIKPTSETEEIDVEKVDEPAKKVESPLEKSKDSPKGTASPSISSSPSAPSSTIPEVTITPLSSPNVSVVSTPQSSVGTTTVFAKPAATPTVITSTASNESSSNSTPVVASPNTTTTPKTTSSSLFSFSTTTPFVFRQTTTTPAATSTSSIFGNPTNVSNVFGQVSSTTPSTNIFGGAPSTTITGSIFGGFVSAKPTFVQAAEPSTTSESILKSPTQTVNAFGLVPATTTAFSQVSTTPSTVPTTPTTTIIINTSEATTTTTTTTAATTLTATPPASTTAAIFGQVTTPASGNAVAQTTSLFDMLLSSDKSQSVFGTSSATSTTTANTFTTPKNLFGGGSVGATSTTTASLFGTTSSSIFPQTTSIFGQPTTSSSLFGQSQTASSNTFFGQSVCSPFGGGTSPTSNQNTFDNRGFNKPFGFGGKSTFGQPTGTTSVFGGSSTSSLFGGTSSTTASNVFQRPTTSTTFGSTSPSSFSSGASSFGTTASSFQKPLGGFGSPPAFGGAPTFGSSATFGGSPSFGSLPTFGSVSQETFGQTTGSTTFENLANQNTVGFGNLAEQSKTQGFGGGFGTPKYENKAGSSSFSSWRSK